MKIVVPTNGKDLDSEISKSYGRCKRFLVVDADTMDIDTVENTQNMESAQGAGIQSSQSAIKAGGDILITLHCGPKAYRVLSEAGVLVYIGTDDSIRENIEAYKNGVLGIMASANVEGHWV